METFITEDFLLHNEFSKRLYHGFAKDLPIIDYHCHLSPKDIGTDRKFRTISEIWLEGDHYKWRAMRTLGVNEKFITGDGSDLEKFQQWAFTVPHTMRNPLYHWTHLELQRYFGIKELLDPNSALNIYTKANDLLQRPEYTTRSLLRRMKVELVGTTDDPTDSLEFHQQLHQENFQVAIKPSFRPDKSFAIENVRTYNDYLKSLGAVTGNEIKTFSDLLSALEKRIEYFHAAGCRISDHGLEQLYFAGNAPLKVEDIFKKLLSGKTATEEERIVFKYSVLLELCRLYHKKGWVQQFHLGALRNTNERMLQKLGPDTGFDSIGDFSQAQALARFFNELDRTNQLTKTIVYNLNPSDNEVIGTMIGNFNDGSVKGKIQFGSAWWFLDQKDGMEKQINSLSNLGLLSCFIGMLTDSRSFLSYPRHEYFRRILCNLIGKDVVNGELPWDEKWLGKLVSDVCYHNAKEYFGLETH
ncbi:MAG TPA: glucuronate isomerase [Chryseosolibacter sp.]